MGVEFDRTVRNGEAEGCADGAFDELDLAAVGANKLGGDDEAQARAAAARRSLKGLEQMLARTRRDAGAGVRHLDHHHGTLAPAGEPDLIADRLPLSLVSRPESASPATGSTGAHKIEQARVVEGALK